MATLDQTTKNLSACTWPVGAWNCAALGAGLKCRDSSLHFGGLGVYGSFGLPAAKEILTMRSESKTLETVPERLFKPRVFAVLDFRLVRRDLDYSEPPLAKPGFLSWSK